MLLWFTCALGSAVGSRAPSVNARVISPTIAEGRNDGGGARSGWPAASPDHLPSTPALATDSLAASGVAVGGDVIGRDQAGAAPDCFSPLAVPPDEFVAACRRSKRHGSPAAQQSTVRVLR